MRQVLLAILIALAAPPVAAVDHAGVAAQAIAHARAGYDRFADATADLATAPCATEPLRAAWGASFDAWIAVAPITYGPIEAEGRRFRIQFWPDPKNFTGRALDRLIAAADPVVDDPSAFAATSVAGQGLMALERLLYPPVDAAAARESYRCRLIAAISRDLAAVAAAVAHEWADETGFALRLATAGAPDNALFLAPDEATRAVFGALDAGLLALADLRLGAPLGSFDAPRPRRAEAWRSGRSMRNARLALAALESYWRAVLAHEAPPQTRARIDAAFAAARAQAERAPDAIDVAVAAPQTRLAVEAVLTRVRALHGLTRADLAPALGVTLGFNSLDGD